MWDSTALICIQRKFEKNKTKVKLVGNHIFDEIFKLRFFIGNQVEKRQERIKSFILWQQFKYFF